MQDMGRCGENKSTRTNGVCVCVCLLCSCLCTWYTCVCVSIPPTQLRKGRGGRQGAEVGYGLVSAPGPGRAGAEPSPESRMLVGEGQGAFGGAQLAVSPRGSRRARMGGARRKPPRMARGPCGKRPRARQKGSVAGTELARGRSGPESRVGTTTTRGETKTRNGVLLCRVNTWLLPTVFDSCACACKRSVCVRVTSSGWN